MGDERAGSVEDRESDPISGNEPEKGGGWNLPTSAGLRGGTADPAQGRGEEGEGAHVQGDGGRSGGDDRQPHNDGSCKSTEGDGRDLVVDDENTARPPLQHEPTMQYGVEELEVGHQSCGLYPGLSGLNEGLGAVGVRRIWTAGAAGLQAYADASFAPLGERSQGCSLESWNGTVIAWKAGKQAFPALSTAECELIEAIDSVILGDSVEALITDTLGLDDFKKMLLSDNAAAVAIATDVTGSWRTRHLRL